MSERELQRIEVLSRVNERRMTSATAAGLLGVSARQVQRLMKTFLSEGAPALRHKARGRPSNNRILDGVRDFALELIREHYIDFGPTLAREKLLERHQLGVSKETLRKWMTEAGIWTLRRERKRRAASAARPPRLSWRDGADRRLASLVVRGARAQMRPTRLHRRRDRPAVTFALCRVGEHVRLLSRSEGLSRGMGQAAGILQ